MNHVSVRNHICYFRFSIPKDLRDIFDCCEIKRSFDTTNYRRSKFKASAMAHNLRDIIRMARRSTLEHKTIKKLVNRHVQETLRWIEDEPLTRDKPISLEDAYGHAEIVQDQAVELKEALVKGDFMQVSHIADSVLEENDINIDPDSMSYKSLCREVLKATIELCKVQAARDVGDYSVQYPGSMDEAGAGHQDDSSEAPLEENSTSLADLIKIYTTENSTVWSRSTIRDYDTISRTMMRIVPPDTQLHAIDKAVMRTYRETLLCLPPRFLTTKKYEGMTAESVRAFGFGPDKTISAQSVNKHLSFVSGLFRYAVDKGYMDINPASNMKVPEKNDARDSVDPFTAEDLKTIFSSQKISEANHPYQFWVPVLGLFTGARRDELCQLYKKDVREEDGIWYLDINQDTPDKSIKNISSKRKIRTLDLENGLFYFHC